MQEMNFLKPSSEKAAPRKTGGDSSRKKMDALTSLRFFAAACIVFHHLRGLFGIPADAYLGVNLACTVSFFFVLSGFVLAYAHPTLDLRAGIPPFLIRRWFRIWPLHVFCLILWCVLMPNAFRESIHAHHGRLEFLANFFLVHAWVPFSSFFFSYNAVSWSVSAEWFFYLCFPFLLYLIIRRGSLIALTAAFVPLLLMLTLSSTLGLKDYSGLNNQITVSSLVYINPLSRLFEFAVGMVLQKMTCRIDNRRLEPYMWILQMIAVCWGICFILFSEKINDLHLSHLLQTWKIFSGGVFIWAFVIWCFSFSNSWPSRLLSNRVLVYLGEISYAIYLIHSSITNIVPLMPGVGLHLSNGAQLTLYFVLLIAIASLLYFLVEMPGRYLGKLLVKKISPRAASGV